MEQTKRVRGVAAEEDVAKASISEIRITSVVAGDPVRDAVRALHRAYELDQA